jgi:hypothetical protein
MTYKLKVIFLTDEKFDEVEEAEEAMNRVWDRRKTFRNEVIGVSVVDSEDLTPASSRQSNDR